MNRLNRIQAALAVTTALGALTLSAAPALSASILIVNGAIGTSEPGTTSEITSNLSASEIAAGNTPTVIDSVTPGMDLSSYAAVWDIRFNPALTASDDTSYTNYLNGGGSLFVMGENDSFLTRDDSIFSLISALGGGSVGFSECNAGDTTETVNPPLTGPNPVTSFVYLAPGGFGSSGTGQYITQDSAACGAAVSWGKGILSDALTGDLVSVLDVNFMEGAAFVGQDSQNFLENLIGYVDNGASPTPPTPPVTGVPEPLTLSLFGAGLVGAAAMQRRRKIVKV